jgi:hypothetical protein
MDVSLYIYGSIMWLRFRFASLWMNCIHDTLM